jgi:hypothetical protein
VSVRIPAERQPQHRESGDHQAEPEHPAQHPGTQQGDTRQIAGLEARVFELAANQQMYPGSCQAQVDTRSMSGLKVLHWNEKKRPWTGNRAAPRRSRSPK